MRDKLDIRRFLVSVFVLFLRGRSAGSFPEQCSVIEPRSVIGQSLGMREGINFDLLRAM